jgi:toxin CcdB
VAQFDVHALDQGGELVVDCQSDLLASLNTRLVVPLMPLDRAPAQAQRLNPLMSVADRELVMVTQFAAAVHVRELGAVVGSLRDRSFEIVGALDVLVSGV